MLKLLKKTSLPLEIKDSITVLARVLSKIEVEIRKRFNTKLYKRFQNL